MNPAVGCRHFLTGPQLSSKLQASLPLEIRIYIAWLTKTPVYV